MIRDWKLETGNPAVFIVKTAAVSALGDSIEEMWVRLCDGESAIQPVTRFSTDRLQFHNAACLPGLASGRDKNRMCDLMIPALDRIKPVSDGTYVIWTGIKGNVDSTEQEDGGPTVPYLAVHYREWVCRYLGIENKGMEVNAACTSSTVGLALGAQMISSGVRSSVLVCGADIVSRFIFTGFSSLRGLSATRCRPFDKGRDGLCLGDGAAALLLVDEKTVAMHGFTPMAKITGWGISNDASHITRPAQDGRGLVQSIRSALHQAALSPENIEAFCAHGTGTVYNDAMELTALERVFGSRRFPLFSVKGAIGHTLGAAGGIEAILSIKAMEEKRVPPTTGLEHPEERAKGRAENSPRPFAGNNILTTNSGFGGSNAALVIENCQSVGP